MCGVPFFPEYRLGGKAKEAIGASGDLRLLLRPWPLDFGSLKDCKQCVIWVRFPFRRSFLDEVFYQDIWGA